MVTDNTGYAKSQLVQALLGIANQNSAWGRNRKIDKRWKKRKHSPLKETQRGECRTE